MDATLQKHGSKHVYRVPEGLRELCADISREVLRTQPNEIYCFIADYIDALLITRENAKIAVQVVNNILLRSESIVDILYQSGFSLEQIAVAATRIQKAFRCYLDHIDVQQAGIHEEKIVDENSRICIRDILESTGSTWEQAEAAASTIQTAFRNHYEEMLAREARGEIQWQRAVVNTIAILRKAGVSQEEASKAATLIQSSYRGYYTRRNIRLKILSSNPEEDSKQNEDLLEPRETIQAVAWMDMMFEDSKYTIERANEAATIIQSVFRGHLTRAHQEKNQYSADKIESSQSMVVEAILDNLRQRVWGKVKSLEKFPEEFGSREELEESVEKIETEYKNRQRKIRISEQQKGDDVEDNVEAEFPGNIDDDEGSESDAERIDAATEGDLKENEKQIKLELDNEETIQEQPEEEDSDVKLEPEMSFETLPESKTEATIKIENEEHREHEEEELRDEEKA